MLAWIHCCSFCDKCASIFVLESPCPLVIRNPSMQLHVSYKNPGFIKKNITLSMAHVFYAHTRKKNNITAELLQLCLIFFVCVCFFHAVAVVSLLYTFLSDCWSWVLWIHGAAGSPLVLWKDSVCLCWPLYNCPALTKHVTCTRKFIQTHKPIEMHIYVALHSKLYF